jgi:hypothetical protein
MDLPVAQGKPILYTLAVAHGMLIVEVPVELVQALHHAATLRLTRAREERPVECEPSLTMYSNASLSHNFNFYSLRKMLYHFGEQLYNELL